MHPRMDDARVGKDNIWRRVARQEFQEALNGSKKARNLNGPVVKLERHDRF